MPAAPVPGSPGIDAKAAGAVLALADRFFAAIEAGDLDAVAGIYAPDAVIWHNSTRAEMSAADTSISPRSTSGNFTSV